MIEIARFRVRGLSPLMQNNPANFITDDSAEGGISAGKKVYDSEVEAALRCYPDHWENMDDPDTKVTAVGPFGHPAASFRRSMMTAGTGRKIGKKAARMIIAGAVFPVHENVTIITEKGKPITEYEMDKRSVVIQKSRILRVRPKFWPWFVDLDLEVDRDFLSMEQVLEVLNISGRIIGVGEFRPDPSGGKSGIGTFGRYDAEFVGLVERT